MGDKKLARAIDAAKDNIVRTIVQSVYHDYENQKIRESKTGEFIGTYTIECDGQKYDIKYYDNRIEFIYDGKLEVIDEVLDASHDIKYLLVAFKMLVELRIDNIKSKKDIERRGYKVLDFPD
jgi:hypothetical protein